MDRKYKLIITGKELYKEAELTGDFKQLKVGTDTGCDVRLQREGFFEPIELLFVKRGIFWIVICRDNLYMTTGDVRKLMTKQLKMGDILEVKYQASNNTALVFEFYIDFDRDINYERCIDIQKKEEICIGCGRTCDIIIKSEYTKSDEIKLIKKDNDYMLAAVDAAYGVYINGKKSKAYDIFRNTDFLSMGDFFFYLKDGRLWTQIRDGISTSLEFYDVPDKNGYPEFKRNTRIKNKICEDKIEILDPPPVPVKPKDNIIIRLIPSFGMLTASLIMAFTDGMMIAFSMVTCVVGMISAIAGIIEGKRDFKKKTDNRIKTYTAYIEAKRKEIEIYRNQEREELEDIYISHEKEIMLLKSFSPELFDRSRDDDDFLCIRLGKGNIEALRAIQYKKKERIETDDNLALIPQEVCCQYRTISDAPIICNLKNVNAIGAVGNLKLGFEILKVMAVDIAIRQHYLDVELFFIAKREHSNYFHMLRFLPHLQNKDLDIRNIVSDEDSKNIIFEYLYKELSKREQNKTYDKRLIVFLYDEYGFSMHPLSRFVKIANALGVTFIFFEDKTDKLPDGCEYIISIKDDNEAQLINAEDKNKTVSFKYSHIADHEAEKIAQFLAPVYTQRTSLEHTLQKKISLFELLNIFDVTDINLKRRWEYFDVTKSMAAPIGISRGGTVFLDLSDKAHGPHGLVAGTTGSGKSELLQTYVLSMAVTYHPCEVSFLLIDFKGGGMANLFARLPHLVGTITNIDGKEADRSLKALKAELSKRQMLFAESNVNHIDKYIKMYRAGEARIPLPHLIIIVDEFAELKAEQPEFMKELISASRIGRSLGVHLILATQKPSGQVNEQIWSNSRFKICLKVQSSQDSTEVLKSPLAAEIKEQGRAYLQVGSNEIFELFQSAYSGEQQKNEMSNEKDFAIYSLKDAGKRQLVYAKKKKYDEISGKTQLEALVDYIENYCLKNKIKKLPDICMPSLKEYISYRNEYARYQTIAVGIYDAPQRQLQPLYGLNVFTENTLIIGAPMTGKTNLLNLIIRSIADNYSPAEVNIYILDFASMSLRCFESLRHVGGVVGLNDDEKLRNLFRLLDEEIIKRKEKFLSEGVSSFGAYKERKNTDIPQLIIIVDNLTALKELYLSDHDQLLPICRDGLSVGISVVIANTQTQGIGYRYLTCFNQRIGLFCSEASEYNTLFNHCRIVPENVPGRCIVQVEKELYEAQLFDAFCGEGEHEKTQKREEFIGKINSLYEEGARNIPTVPKFLSEKIMNNEWGAFSDKDKLAAGLDYDEAVPVYIEYIRQEIIGIAGSRSKEKFINYLKKIFMSQCEYLYILDDYSLEYHDISKLCKNVMYSRKVSDIELMLERIADILSKRYAIREKEGLKSVRKLNPIVLIINSDEAVKYIDMNTRPAQLYRQIIQMYKGLKLLILITGIDNEAINYSSPEILRHLKDNRQFILFEDLNRVKLFDIPLALLKNQRKPLNENEAFFVSGSDIKRIKTISIF